MQSQSNILALFQQLRGRSKAVQQTAAASLMNLAFAAGGPAAILQSGAELALLAARVGNGRSSFVRYRVLLTLNLLAVPVEGRPPLVAAGAIPAAVGVLRSSSDAEMLLNAAGLLRTMAHDINERVPAMVDAGAFEVLTDVLRRSSEGRVLEQVGCALCNATASNKRSHEAAAAAACASCAAAAWALSPRVR